MGDSFLSRIPTVESQLEESNPELIARLEQAKIAYKEKFGKDLPITSKVRTREEQQDLYNRWKKKEKGIYMPLNPADYPNQKIFHTDAADISTEVPDAFLKEFGLHRPLGKNDPVHTVIDPSFKKAAVEKTTEIVPTTQDDFLSRIPSEEQLEKIKLSEPTESIEREYKPGYFNPNLVAQGERAREAGGGNLQPIVEGVTNALGGMSFEDWKKESLIANMLKYGAGSMPIIGDEQLKEEGRQKLLQTGEAAINALSNPRETLQAISQQEPGELLGQMIKGGIYDAPLGLATKPITSAVSAVAKPVMSAAGKALTPVGEGFDSLQEAFQKLKPPTKAEVTLEGANYRPDLDTQMSGVGAANADLTTRLEEAISRANPEKQNLLKQLSLKNLTEQDLKAIETHNKFDKFNMTPTEGQALQDTTKMSNEFNARKQDPNLQERFEERDPKLIEGFNKIRETVAPDVYESNPAKLANAGLEKMKQNYLIRNKNEELLYKNLADANGGNLPFNISDLKNTIDTQLKKDKAYRATIDNPIYKELEDQMALGTMTYDDMIHYRTRLSAAMRSSKDGNVTHGLGVIYDKLHEMPLPENLAHLRPLDDAARNAFKQHKELQKSNPAYKAAINDTRTDAEINSGILHPAANTFLDKFYGRDTPQVEINRLLNEIGVDSLEHQSLNAATIDKIKRASGVKGEFGNESGTISQAALSDQLNKIYGNNLPTMFKQDHIKDLKDLSDVATLTEPRKGVHSVNTSNSEILAQENRAKTAAKETASKIGAGIAEAGINAKLPGVGTIGRSILKGRAEQKALDLEKIKKAEESKRRLSPIAGIGTKLQDIGKE